MKQTENLVKYVIQDFRKNLSGIYPDQEILQFIYILFEDYLGWNKTRVHLSFDVELPGAAMKLFHNALAELRSGRPIQHIIGKTLFNGTLLKVNSDVLIPRPETGELCEIIKQDFHEFQQRQFSILDIGTGSGCIAIDLKLHFTGATVTAMDSSLAALEIARGNAASNQCEISFVKTDILDSANWKNFGQYDLIVSNPPYVLESEKQQMHPNVTEFEPAEALFVDDNDPLIFYRAISDFAFYHLNRPAYLYVEINERFATGVIDLVLSFGFEDAGILHDFHGKERFVKAMLPHL